MPVKQIIPEDELFVNPENGSKVTHADKWMNYESRDAIFVVNWYKSIIKNKPGTFSISGIVSDNNGRPLTGALVETGFLGVDYNDACTHFTITDSSGWYELKGIVPGKRFINVVSEEEAGKILKTKDISLSENFKLDIIVDENYVPVDTEVKYLKATSQYAQKPCVKPKMTSEHSSPENEIQIVPEGVKRIDIILLLGQSNMKGRGKVPDHQEAHPRIIYMNMTNDKWYSAVHPLHTDGIPDLIDGKSNAGVGPGLDFTRVLAEKDTSACIALIPCAKGGSWINLWMPGKTQYNESIRRARRALLDFLGKNIEVKISAALWLQGESDAIEGRYQVYREKLKILVDSLRADLDIPDLPFISATIGPFMEAISHKYPYYKEINSIFLNVGNEIESYRCVDARDLNAHIGDHIHYNAFSQQEIGKRMARTWFEMNQK